MHKPGFAALGARVGVVPGGFGSPPIHHAALACDESSLGTGGVYLADGVLSAISFRSRFGRTPFRSIQTTGGGIMRLLTRRLIDWPESIAGYLAWLGPLVAGVTVGWVFMLIGCRKLTNI